MKPIAATEFTIPMDISEAAIEEGIKLLSEIKLKESIGSNYEVRISSQDMSDACIAVNAINNRIDIKPRKSVLYCALDFTYAQYEWSIRRIEFIRGGPYILGEIWSPGV